MRRVAIFVILLLAYLYYRSAGDAQLASIGLLVLRRDRAARAGLLRRPDLAPRHRARRARRHDRRHPGVGLHAAAAELRRRRHRRPATSSPTGRSDIGAAAAAASARPRPAAAGARRALEPGAQHRSPMSASRCARAPTPIERLQANLFVPSELAPMAPSFRLWRSSVTVEELTTTVARYLGEERTRIVVRELRRQPAHQPRSQGRGRLPAGALCRAYARLGDRRGLVAAGAVAAAAQAHGLDQGRAQAARRRQCGDPVQPRNPADRARPRAPGHRGVRQGSAADLLEPAVRRNPRPAAEPDPRRHRARRDPALQRASAATSRPSRVDDSCTSSIDALRLRQRAVPASASPSAAW